VVRPDPGAIECFARGFSYGVVEEEHRRGTRGEGVAVVAEQMIPLRSAGLALTEAIANWGLSSFLRQHVCGPLSR